MTRIGYFPILTSAMAIAFSFASLGPPTSKQVRAQGTWAAHIPQPYAQAYYSTAQPYYGTAQAYYSTAQPYYGAPQAYYSTTQPYYGGYPYNAYGAGYANVHQSGYRGYGITNDGYTAYGNGQYVYGSPGMFRGAAPSIIYGTSYGPANRVFRYGGPGYPAVYAPTSATYYSPYSYQR